MAMAESPQDSSSVDREGLDSRSSTPHSFTLSESYHRRIRRPRPKYCMALERFINSPAVQISVIVFVILTCLIVTTELLLAYHLLKIESSETEELVSAVLHYISFIILMVFVFEVLLRVCAMSVDYFHQPLEIFDGLVVFLTFTLDLSLWLSVNHPAVYTVTYLILLRLCRIHLIWKGLKERLREEAAIQTELERIGKHKAEHNITKLTQQCDQQNKEILFLKDLLRQHNIESLQMNGNVTAGNSIQTDLIKFEATKFESNTTSPGTTNASTPTFTDRKSVNSLDETKSGDKYADNASQAILQSAMVDIANKIENDKNISILEKSNITEEETAEPSSKKETNTFTSPTKSISGSSLVQKEAKESDTAIMSDNLVPSNSHITGDSRLTDLDTLNLELAEIRRISQEALLQDFTEPVEGIDNPAIPTTSL